MPNPYQYPYSEESKAFLEKNEQFSKPELPAIYSFANYQVPNFVPLQGIITVKSKENNKGGQMIGKTITSSNT